MTFSTLTCLKFCLASASIALSQYHVIKLRLPVIKARPSLLSSTMMKMAESVKKDRE